MYDKVSANLNFVEREKKVEEFWKANDIFQKSIDQRDQSKSFTFYDGPPTANGKPHIGHVLTRVIKDMIPRYKAMKGYHILRKAGWDTHGLPVELEVEKKLGLDGKEQIEEYGLEPFIRECKESVWKYKGMWEDFSGTVGFWADMNDPYVTYHNEYIESEWWALKQIWEKGLLYKGFKIVPYCPRCETPLSSHEVAQGYKDVKEKSAIAKFRIKGTEDEYFLAWTTTPWTLPSNVALCVNAEETYVKVRVKSERSASGFEKYILAEALVPAVIGVASTAERQNPHEGAEAAKPAKASGEAAEANGHAHECECSHGEHETTDFSYTTLETCKGKDLEFMEYEPLFNFKPLDKKAYYITCDSYVTLSDGTGIVHIAPAFGEDDANVGRKYDLPFLQLVNSRGEMTEETSWAGTFCKDADPLILTALKENNLLFKTLNYEHSYPFCWRCDTPLIYYARDSWFIKMTAVRDNLIKNNNTINWIPESIGKGRFGDWLINVQDWGISRDRYWGTPLNIWECECGHRHSIGSISELKEMSDNCPADIELHRPFIDSVTIKCPLCGKEMKRVKEVIDCWFDSGAMPFAQWHYPFENHDIFNAHFPADFISEAVDQTRGWFYSLLAISTLLFDVAPYKNVIVLGHVQDENGQKMSKSKGNAVDPFEALEQYGADAVRWYFYINSAPWLPNRFHGGAVTEGQRKFMGTLWNTYAFFILYANIDEFDAAKYTLDYKKLSVMDKWMLSRLNTLVASVDEYLGDYRITEAARALQSFVDDLSNWYVRRSRERFWEKGMPQDKINAYMTLYTTLVTLVKTAAPMIPFMSEDIYRNLVCSIDKNAPESVHLCDFPVADTARIDKQLEEAMNLVLDITVLGRSCRNTANIKNRQPIGRMFVFVADGVELSDFYKEIIADELNLKNIEFTSDVKGFSSYSFKPQLKTLGPKFGKNIGLVRTILSEIDGNAAMEELNSTGKLKLTVDNADYYVTADDLLIESSRVPGYEAATDRGITVVLDTNLTPELIEEGFVREIISKLQTMRKEAGFEVMDRIVVYHKGNDRIKEIMERNLNEIKDVVLADYVVAAVGGSAVDVAEVGVATGITVEEGTGSGIVMKEWNLNGEDVTLGVKRV